ncbi:MAG: glycosyltransferase, partial [Christensenellaceae bacterium]
NNFAATQAKGNLLLFLNNDVSVISPDWLEQMAMHAVRKEIGAVGAKLYYPDDTLQHGGVILKIGEVAGHSHKHTGRYEVGSFARLTLVHDVSAVTAACVMIRKDVFFEIGGFDEQFVVAFNDVDLCLKIREKGYYIVWTPFAELYHYESKTRGYEETPEKIKRFENEQQKWLAKWDEKYPYDPFYNKNLTAKLEDYSINPHKITL